MFWTFTLSFDVDILAFFGLATLWATFKKLGDLKKIFRSPCSQSFSLLGCYILIDMCELVKCQVGETKWR
jgi:hypothetical protein